MTTCYSGFSQKTPYFEEVLREKDVCFWILNQQFSRYYHVRDLVLDEPREYRGVVPIIIPSERIEQVSTIIVKYFGGKEKALGGVSRKTARLPP